MEKEENTAKQVDIDVLRELKCPACDKYMEPPITLCNNGHNTCKNCIPKRQSCPTCRANFLKTRNLALENLARTVMYPCKNKDAGCEEIFSMNMKIRHLHECFYKSLICPFDEYAGVSCPWNGLLSEIKEHVLNDHGFETDTRQENGAFAVTLKDISASKRYTAAMAKLDLFFIIWEMRAEDFFCVVVLIGSKEEAAEYKYRFTIATPSGMEIISTCFVAQTYLNDLEQILQPGECVTLRYGTVTKFKNAQNALICEMEIYESGHKPIEILRKSEVTSSKILTIVPRSFFLAKDDEDAE
ncbi:hypothetical protein C0J52_27867 [Blattella germanica]|nr:hypothetical protein C0J52_27867 [Blattella germanica]